MPAFSASAPGKTILFGEHAAVYGHPAIALPLPDVSLTVIVQALPNQQKIRIVNKGMDEDFFLDGEDSNNQYSFALETIKNYLKIDHMPALQLTISSNIPTASGLGSSAAFAVAMTKAVTGFLGFRLAIEDLNDIAFEIEMKQHGTPSGIDNSVVCYQKPAFFRKGQPVEFIYISKPMTIVLANSGIRSFTKEAVDQIRKKRNKETEFVDHIFNHIGNIANNARISIEQGDLETTGKLMLDNHRWLKELGLSLEKLDDLVETSMRFGAYGAKLCGSGKGGNVVALVPPAKVKNIEKSLLETGAESCIVTTIAPNAGVL